MNKKVYIIIINYNGWQETVECIESILKSSYDNYQIILVDNASNDDSVKKIDSWTKGKLKLKTPESHPLHALLYPICKKPLPYKLILETENLYGSPLPILEKLIFIKTHDNLGFSAGNNIALKYLLKHNEDCFVWLLNPDMIIEQESLKKLMECSTKHKDSVIGTVHKDYNHPEDILLIGGWRLFPALGLVRPVKDYGVRHKIDFISGGSLFADLNNFKDVGLLPEEYFLYWEDADWCERAKRSGKDLYVCKDSICYDKGSTTIGKNSYLAEYLYTRNSFHFAEKFHSRFYILSITIMQLMKLVKRILNINTTACSAIINGTIDHYKS